MEGQTDIKSEIVIQIFTLTADISVQYFVQNFGQYSIVVGLVSKLHRSKVGSNDNTNMLKNRQSVFFF